MELSGQSADPLLSPGCGSSIGWCAGLWQLLPSLLVAVGAEQYLRGSRARGPEVWAQPRRSWEPGWLLPPSLERLFVKINNGMLVWERALNQLFLLSYRCLFFKAMYSAKHTASITEIATEQPSNWSQGSQTKSHLFLDSEKGIQWKPDGSTLKIAVYLSSMPRVAQR